MANKAVVGVAALGVSGYMVSEHIKDWQAKKEQREREQEREDNREARERRFREKMVRKCLLVYNICGSVFNGVVCMLYYVFIVYLQCMISVSFAYTHL